MNTIVWQRQYYFFITLKDPFTDHEMAIVCRAMDDELQNALLLLAENKETKLLAHCCL